MNRQGAKNAKTEEALYFVFSELGDLGALAVDF
jgi:hypothetical protein